MPDRRSLEALLKAYEPSDAEELGHKTRMLELLSVRGDPFDRAHFVPGHFTASSFVLSADATQLLLIEHSKLQRWLQPGGHVDAGDGDILGAARRELHEETGLRDLPLDLPGVFDLDVHRIPAHGQNPAHEHFDVRFLFRAGDAAARAGSDAKAARFVELTKMGEVESDRSVMRAVDKLLSRTMRVNQSEV